MGSNNENDRVASPESVPVHLNVYGSSVIFSSHFYKIKGNNFQDLIIGRICTKTTTLKRKDLFQYEQILSFKGRFLEFRRCHNFANLLFF